jgi:HlyD family secretion protein
VREGLTPQQSLDDAQGRYDSAVHRVNSLQKTYELVKLGPRQEEIDSLRGQVEQAKGAVAYAETNLDNTIIRAPVTGTILERAVEKGEFVTTSFVGDQGRQGLRGLHGRFERPRSGARYQPERFRQAALRPARNHHHRRLPGPASTTGFIKEISPEANRQKATVQIKVKVEKPDDHLRPEMNASVAFLSDEKPEAALAASRSQAGGDGAGGRRARQRGLRGARRQSRAAPGESRARRAIRACASKKGSSAAKT